MCLRVFFTLVFLFTSCTLLFASQRGSSAVQQQASTVAEEKNQRTISWKRWTPKVFEQAKKENRLLLVDFAAEWCQFCKKMDKTTWLDARVQASINEHYIPVRVDDEVDPEIAEKYRSYGRPVIVVLNGDGTEIAKKRGYLKPQWMYWTLEGIAQNPTPEANR